MHSFLIVSKNKDAALNYVKVECKKSQTYTFDVALLTFQKAIGIEDVRNIQKKIFLKPIKSKTKAIILEAYNGITIPAQNALLKLLEEPPDNTIIYIISANKELFLPTILSRCKVIDLKQEIQTLSKQELLSSRDILVYLQSKEIGGKLKLAQDLAKNKDNVIPWLEKMIIVARQQLLETYNKKLSTLNSQLSTPQYLNILISLQKTYTVLKTTNANPRLTLENLFLNL